MPKVLRVLNRLNIGGPTYNVAYLSKYISSDFQTRVLAGLKEPHEGSSAYMLSELGVPFEYVPDMYRSIRPVKDSRAFNYLRHEVQKYQPDIVHTHAAKAGVLGRLAAHYSSVRPKGIVHTYHGNVFDGYFSPLKTKIFLNIERYLCRISDAVVAISEAQKNDLVNKYRIVPEHKVHVIKLGFDLDKFTDGQEAKRRQFRSFYHIGDDELVITITGRLTAIKNHSLLIQSLKLLKDEAPGIKFKVFIVGDGELLEPIVALVKQCGFSCCLPGNNNYTAEFIFTSWRKDIDVINAGSDVIALTSLNEGTPVSIIEALASCKGVISTDVGGVKDVVKDGKTGMLADLTPAMYAHKLREILVNSELRARMAVAGQRFALQNYSYHRLVKETEELYKYLLH